MNVKSQQFDRALSEKALLSLNQELTAAVPKQALRAQKLILQEPPRPMQELPQESRSRKALTVASRAQKLNQTSLPRLGEVEHYAVKQKAAFELCGV